jgi:hypothetical protein
LFKISIVGSNSGAIKVREEKKESIFNAKVDHLLLGITAQSTARDIETNSHSESKVEERGSFASLSQTSNEMRRTILKGFAGFAYLFPWRGHLASSCRIHCILFRKEHLN